MPGMFCRHNRLTSKCPICARELREATPVRHVTVRKPGATSTPKSRAKSSSGSSLGLARLRPARHAPARAGDRRRLPQPARARPEGDGRCRAARDRGHAGARAARAARAVHGDRRDARRRARDLARVPVRARARAHDLIDETRPAWEDAADLDALPAAKAKTAASYRAWVERAGSQEAAFTGEEIWTPERRFGRVFERLALPGFTRAMRFDLLTALGAADIYPLEADALHFADDDPTTDAAKRLLVSGDRMLLERRARDLADASEMPISAFDRGLAVWGAPTVHVDLTAEPAPGDRCRPRPEVEPVAFAPLTALAPGASRMLDRLAPPPETTDTGAGAGAPVAAAARRLPRAGRALAAAPVGPDVRPVGVDHLGSRGRAPGPRDHDRAELEAAAGDLHDAVQPRGRRRRAAAVARRGARGRHPRVRDGVPAGQASRRPGRRADRGGLADPRRRVHPQLLPRQLRGHPGRASACGRSSATSTAAAATPSCSASPPRCCAPRCGRSSRSTAST